MTDTNRTDTHVESAAPLRPAALADDVLATSLRDLERHGLGIVCDMTPTQPAVPWDGATMNSYFLHASERLKAWAAAQLQLAADARATADTFNATHFPEGAAADDRA